MKQKMEMLKQMAAVTEAQYLKEHAKIKPILDHEARLRGQLTKLEQQVQEAREQADGDIPMRALGADLVRLAFEHPQEPQHAAGAGHCA